MKAPVRVNKPRTPASHLGDERTKASRNKSSAGGRKRAGEVASSSHRRSPALGTYLQATAALWLFVGVLRARDVVRAGASVVFLFALSAAAVFVAASVVELARKGDPFGTASRGVVLLLLAAVPVTFDAHTTEAFNLPRYTLVVVSAFVLAGLWVAAESNGPRQSWRNGLHWPVLALLAWTAVTTATSLNPRVSLLGEYKSYDGFFAATGLAVLFFAIARTFTTNHVRTALSVLYFAGGGVCVLYGFIQLADRTWGTSWDWLPWGNSESFPAGSSIWSTFGNPNHLAGFLAVLFPIGVVLFILHRRWWARGLVAVVQCALVLELLQTTTRGAWLATLTATAVLVLLCLPDLIRRPKAAFSLASGVVALVLVAVLALGSPAGIARQLRSIVDFEGRSGAVQRMELWETGAKMANDRPLLGVGPDAYASAFQEYKTPRLVRLFGTTVDVNGPHNVFVNYLAGQGYPGLVGFVAVLSFALLRAVGAWRRLRCLERKGPDASRFDSRATRLALAAVAAGLVAYVVQASFNVQQVGLTFVFWALLGLLCVLARDAGVPATLRPRSLVAAAPDPANALPFGDAQLGKRRDQDRKRAAQPASQSRVANPSGALIGLLAAAGFMIFTQFASRPYRADRSFFAATLSHSTSAGLQRADGDRALRIANDGWVKIQRAVRLNPWEPSYVAVLAHARAGVASQLPKGSPQQLEALHDAASLYDKTVRLDPRDTKMLQAYAKVLITIHERDPSKASSTAARAEAVEVLERARKANPFDKETAAQLRQLRSLT